MKHPLGGRERIADADAGFIVLGPLILIAVTVVVMVVAGKLLYPPPPTYIVADRPTLHIAASAGQTYRNSRPVAHIASGDSLWVLRVGDGSVVLFTDSTGVEVIGFSPVPLRPVVLTGR